MRSLAEVLLEVVLADRALRVLQHPIPDAVSMEGMEAQQEGLFISTLDIIQTNGAVGCAALMLTSRKQIEEFLLQSSIILLFFLVVEDKHVPIGAILILNVLSSSSWGIEDGIHVGSDMLELLEELLSKRKAVVDDWVVSILTVDLSSLISVTAIASVVPSISSISSVTSISTIPSIPSITSSALHVELVLIAGLLPRSILRIIAPIPISILIVVILPLLLLLSWNPIIDSIGVLTIDGGDIVSGDFIIAPVEAAYKVVSCIFEGIAIAVDLQIDVAELQVEVIVIPIDGDGKVRVANVDDVVVARDIEVSLLAVDEVLGVIVKYIHSGQMIICSH